MRRRANEEERFLAYLEVELDKIHVAKVNLANAESMTSDEFAIRILGHRDEPDAAEKAAARRGNINPLREKHPDLAEFLRVPKMKRGHTRSRTLLLSGTAEARAQAVARQWQDMKRIWLEFHYGGDRKNISKGDADKLLDAAAKFFDVGANSIKAAMKTLSNRKT